MKTATISLAFIILAILCASCSNKKEQEQAEIAINATMPDVAIMAVSAVNNEALLGKIAIAASTQEAANAALKKINKLTTQQGWLYDAAANATHANIRLFAVEKVDDQAILTHVVTNDTDEAVLTAALPKLTDETLLGAVAKNAKDWRVRAYAASKVTDQVALRTLATRDAKPEVRYAATNRLVDQAALSTIAKHDAHEEVRFMALGKVVDQAVIADVARDDRNDNVRALAVDKLTDQSALADVVIRDSVEEIRAKAFQKLSAQAELARVAKDGKNNYSMRAAEKVTDESLAIDIARNTPESYIYVVVIAIRNINDQSFLEQMAAKRIEDYENFMGPSSYSSAREAAINKIASRAFLTKLLNRCSSYWVPIIKKRIQQLN